MRMCNVCTYMKKENRFSVTRYLFQNTYDFVRNLVLFISKLNFEANSFTQKYIIGRSKPKKLFSNVYMAWVWNSCLCTFYFIYLFTSILKGSLFQSNLTKIPKKLYFLLQQKKNQNPPRGVGCKMDSLPPSLLCRPA